METSTLIGITDLRQNAKDVIDRLGDRPVTILSRSKPVAILLRPDRYEALVDRIDELSAQVAIERAAGDTEPWDTARKQLEADGIVDPR